eukprot:TRINITY_DN149_c0_g1_i3.p1 TRINITY_DN149_c0_g1~~TRINITY_DN149_c0_g1_i3.p1  ORF type:complete len:188 (-),score=21.31 TRINITY_DN149_c0_g1_i3:179-742(-)
MFLFCSDDVSLVVVLLDTNPFFWAIAKNSNNNNPNLSFSNFLNHVLPFLNSILLLNQINQVVVIATGVNSCGYIYDSSSSPPASAAKSEDGNMPGIFSRVIQKLEEFVIKDQELSKDESVVGNPSSLLSGSLSLALCCIRFDVSPLFYFSACDCYLVLVRLDVSGIVVSVVVILLLVIFRLIEIWGH